ncbi:hypothetical protein RAB80_014008 [Fusarium oxysporum f. sp. vasinfectum]|nr:hypothetical protein RAB80_014008 [Fusarium oxysporum f. sp. vasinfectum]
MGFACTWPACGHLTPSWKWLRVHFNEEHNIKGAKARADHWTSVYLQTFFAGPKRAIRYFCLRVSTHHSDDAISASAEGPLTPAGRGEREKKSDDGRQGAGAPGRSDNRCHHARVVAAAGRTGEDAEGHGGRDPEARDDELAETDRLVSPLRREESG